MSLPYGQKISNIVGRMFVKRPDLAGEPPLATLARGLIDQNNTLVAQVDPVTGLLTQTNGGPYVAAGLDGKLPAVDGSLLTNLPEPPDPFFARLPRRAKIHGANVVMDIDQQGSWDALWTTWRWASIAHQLDLAAANGFNTVRLIGSTLAIQLGHLTESAYYAHVDQFCSYAASKGLLVYACLGENNAPGGTVLADHAALLSRMLAVYQAHPNVIACDVLNEPDNNTNSIDGVDLMTGLGTIYTTLKAIATIPLTFSLIGFNSPGGEAESYVVASYISALAAVTDFFDFHGYTALRTYQMRLVLGYGRPILFGEFGLNTTPAENYGIPIANIQELLELPQVVGALVWSLQDFGTASQDVGWSIFNPDGTLTTYGQGVVNLPKSTGDYSVRARSLGNPYITLDSDPAYDFVLSDYLFVSYSSPSGSATLGVGSMFLVSGAYNLRVEAAPGSGITSNTTLPITGNAVVINGNGNTLLTNLPATKPAAALRVYTYVAGGITYLALS